MQFPKKQGKGERKRGKKGFAVPSTEIERYKECDLVLDFGQRAAVADLSTVLLFSPKATETNLGVR